MDLAVQPVGNEHVHQLRRADATQDLARLRPVTSPEPDDENREGREADQCGAGGDEYIEGNGVHGVRPGDPCGGRAVF